MGGDSLKGEQAPHGRQAADLTEQGKENARKKLTQGLEELGVMLLAAFAVLVMVPAIIVPRAEGIFTLTECMSPRIATRLN